MCEAQCPFCCPVAMQSGMQCRKLWVALVWADGASQLLKGSVHQDIRRCFGRGSPRMPFDLCTVGHSVLWSVVIDSEGWKVTVDK